MSNENEAKRAEYDRLAAEILQGQRIRITLFTFSVTTCAALVGLSLREEGAHNTPVLAAAAYTILMPCVILVHHYTGSVNSISEYLRVFHDEKWMVRFDRFNLLIEKPTEEVRAIVGPRHHFLVRLQFLPTAMAFSIAYGLMSIMIASFGLWKTAESAAIERSVFVIGLILTTLIIVVFYPVNKARHHGLWEVAERTPEREKDPRSDA